MTSPKSARKATEAKPDKDKKPPKLLMMLSFVSAIALMSSSVYLTQNNRLKLSGSTSAASLKDFASKLEFTGRYWVLGLSWLVFAIMNVGRGRGKNKALDPLAGNDHLLAAEKNILTNSLEQFVMSVGVQVSILPYLTATQVLKWIPLMNVLFFVGRIAFFLGYPKLRTFGFANTFFPTLAAIGYTAYCFSHDHLELF